MKQGTMDPITDRVGLQVWSVICGTRRCCLALLMVVVGLVAVGTFTATPVGASGTWSGPTNLAGYGQSISCASTDFCMAVDDAGNAYTFNGTSWSGPTLVDGTSFLYSVSCPTNSFCVAGDDVGSVFIYSAGSWSGAINIESAYIVSVSCSTTTFCIAASDSNVMIYNGSGWSEPYPHNPIDSPHNIYAVSCTTGSFCVVSDDAGNVLTTTGGYFWSAPNNVSTNALVVSCATSTFCMAHDYFGNVVTYDGTSWSSPTLASLSLTALSCTDNVLTSDGPFCVGVDGAGNEITYTAGAFEAPVSIDSSTYQDSVSCSSESFCATFDATGNVLTYANGIVGNHNACGASCTTAVAIPATPNTPAQTITVAGTPTSPTGTVDLNVTWGTLACPTVNPAQAPIADLTDAGFATARLTLTAVLQNTSRPASKQVCFNSSVPFRNRSSPTTPVAGTALLLKCSKTHNVAPCLKSSKQVGRNVIVTFYAPGGDPRFHIVGPSDVEINREFLPAAIQNQFYQRQLYATGGTLPYRWKLTSGSLPQGIKLNARTGVLSGTAKRVGTYSFVVTASDHEKPPLTSALPGSITVEG